MTNQKLLRNDDEDTETPEADEEDEEEETEVVEAGKHDDASFLLELYQSIKGHTFRDLAEGFVPSLRSCFGPFDDVRHLQIGSSADRARE